MSATAGHDWWQEPKYGTFPQRWVCRRCNAFSGHSSPTEKMRVVYDPVRCIYSTTLLVSFDVPGNQSVHPWVTCEEAQIHFVMES